MKKTVQINVALIVKKPETMRDFRFFHVLDNQ